jgi:hypothetical protein
LPNDENDDIHSAGANQANLDAVATFPDGYIKALYAGQRDITRLMHQICRSLGQATEDERLFGAFSDSRAENQRKVAEACKRLHLLANLKVDSEDTVQLDVATESFINILALLEQVYAKTCHCSESPSPVTSWSPAWVMKQLKYLIGVGKNFTANSIGMSTLM